MAQAQRYKLTLSKLDFISLVDDPAQPNATTLLIKRKGKQDELQAVAKYLDADESLGLAWFWAFTSTEKSGEPHYDHHGDQVAADSDMVRAVLDYMKRGGAVDEMHDYEPTAGQVVFAMPITADVAKTIGIAQTGLLVTIKCTSEQIAKLKDGTYTGVSIAGLGTREPIGKVRKAAPAFAEGDRVIALANHMDGMKGMAGKVSTARAGDPPYYGVRFDDQEAMPGEHKWLAEDEIEAEGGAMKSKVVKHSLFTDEVDGHAHSISIYEDGTFGVNYATMAGAEYSHGHGIVRGADGALTILADSGHTHQLADGQPAVIVVPEGAVVVTEVAARRIPTTKPAGAPDRAGDSPRPVAGTTVKTLQEQSKMKTAEEKLADLEKSHADTTKRLERAERIAKMSGAHKTHFDALKGEEADAFLAKSDVERSQAIETLEKADPVEFELDGIAYRKSTQGYALAKRLLAEVEKNDRVEIEKSATALVGDASPGALVVARAIRSIAKQEDREAAEKLLKQLVATSRIGKSAPGGDGGTTVADAAGTPLEALTKGLVEFCKAEKIDDKSMWTVGLPKFEKTEKGRDLKAAYDEARS